MTSLNSYIPIEYVKQSKKLQEIEARDNHTGSTYPAPTIADVIDNTEELWETYYTTFINDETKEIIEMCQQNKSIEEISTYIIKNII